MTERERRLGRKTRKETGKWNQMTALRFQRGGVNIRYPQPPFRRPQMMGVIKDVNKKKKLKREKKALSQKLCKLMQRKHPELNNDNNSEDTDHHNNSEDTDHHNNLDSA